jgi:hypothetical protein
MVAAVIIFTAACGATAPAPQNTSAPASTSTAAVLASTATAVPEESQATPESVATEAVSTAMAQPESQPTPESGAATDTASDGPFPFAYNPLVADMLSEIEQSAVADYTAALTGETEITVDGEAYTLETRDQYEEESISLATQYAYEFMDAEGISVSFHEWEDSDEELAGRDVVGEIEGTARPDEIVLITAHLDSTSEEDLAPGADDNASGSVAVMMAAKLLADHSFERTVRFILFTGEEVNQCGSSAYAQEAKENDENIVAVFNMDMIGWDDNGDGVIALETRYITDTGYTDDLAIANVFIQVVGAYDLGSPLNPSIDAISDEEVDSWSFWEINYPSITAIEDFSGAEMNPYYHTDGDTLETLNMPYFTAFVKASVATAAHLALLIE